MKLEDLDERLRKKVENKQKTITTLEDLSNFNYKICKKFESRKIEWIEIDFLHQNQHRNYLKYQSQKLEKSHNWYIKNKARKLETNRVWRSNNKEKAKKHHQKYIETHKDQYNAQRRKYMYSYRKKGKMKLKDAKQGARKRERGFIPLFKLDGIENIEIEWHHVNKILPYTIPVPKEIHQSIHGTNPNHYLGVVAKFYNWLGEHPEIKIEELLK